MSVFAMDPEDRATDKTALIRFSIQDKMLNPSSYEHLKKAGLSKGQIVWEIGCRNGVMTSYLAKAVGESGHVYTIDKNEEHLKMAKSKVEEEGLKNVTFIHGDIGSQKDLSAKKADLVYMRLILMHEKEPDSLIRAAKDLLKEGGVMVSQESTMSTSHSSSDNKIFREYVDASIALGKQLGIDYDIGRRLQSLFEQAGYGKAEVYYLQPKVGIAAVKQILPSILAEGKVAAASGIISREKVENWEHVISNWPADDETFSYAPAEQAYVLAWKENRP